MFSIIISKLISNIKQSFSTIHFFALILMKYKIYNTFFLITHIIRFYLRNRIKTTVSAIYITNLSAATTYCQLKPSTIPSTIKYLPTECVQHTFHYAPVPDVTPRPLFAISVSGNVPNYLWLIIRKHFQFNWKTYLKLS